MSSKRLPWWRGMLARKRRAESGPTLDLAVELKKRGVSPSSCQAILSVLEARVALASAEKADGLLEGVALAFEFQEGSQLQLLRTLREVQEVEKMMGAFSGELLKLDEVLEVLSTYVRRMRSSGRVEDGGVLH